MNVVLFYLQVSRIGLWFATIWLYLVQTFFLDYSLVYSFRFLLGLFYVAWPINFMMYGINDFIDLEADHLNPRKRSFWIGNRYSRAELDSLVVPILLSQFVFYPIFYYLQGWGSVFWLFICLLLNILYNIPNPNYSLRGIPPFELFSICGLMAVIPLAADLNEIDIMPWQLLVCLATFLIQAQLGGEIIDYKADALARRRNTATYIKPIGCKILSGILIFSQIIILGVVYKEVFLTAFATIILVWNVYVILFTPEREDQDTWGVLTPNELSWCLYTATFYIKIPFLVYGHSFASK